MTLKEYFEAAHGTGVLATADVEGRVDAAIYSAPHVFDDGTIAFVMRGRLTPQQSSVESVCLISLYGT